MACPVRRSTISRGRVCDTHTRTHTGKRRNYVSFPFCIKGLIKSNTGASTCEHTVTHLQHTSDCRLHIVQIHQQQFCTSQQPRLHSRWRRYTSVIPWNPVLTGAGMCLQTEILNECLFCYLPHIMNLVLGVWVNWVTFRCHSYQFSSRWQRPTVTMLKNRASSTVRRVKSWNAH